MRHALQTRASREFSPFRDFAITESHSEDTEELISDFLLPKNLQIDPGFVNDGEWGVKILYFYQKLRPWFFLLSLNRRLDLTGYAHW